jgi:dUTP pyrophosphatase
MELLRVKKLTEFAVMPTRGSKFAAGFDLSSAYDITVPKNGKAIVKTDLSIAIPPETYARVGKQAVV